jgi:Domain of unknown function (DUF305)
LEKPKELSFRSAALSREESAASLPAASRFLADEPGFGMTMDRVVLAQSCLGSPKRARKVLSPRGCCMKRTAWQFTFLLVVASTIGIPAMSAGAHVHGGNAATEPGWSELMRSMGRMHVAMSSVGSSKDSDVDFVKLMLVHHQVAIDMARTELVYGKDAQMRRLAQEIITDQKSEIDLMQLWLQQHQPGSPQVTQPPAPQASKEQ